ncbi:hypothetical protein GYB22_00115 [bacterium]|nr:hypothetical protein [bacterium]
MIKYLLIIGMLFCGIQLRAQDNDTAKLAKLNVSQVEKYIYIHAFEGRNDTCLYFHQELDSQTRPTYERINMGCYGYSSLEEYTYKYSDTALEQLSLVKNNEPFTRTSYEFYQPELPSVVNTYYYETADSTQTLFEYYFGEYRQPDSSEMTVIDQFRDTVKSKTIARFDDSGRVVEIISMDADRITQQEVSYELNENGDPLSVATSVYGERPMFVQNYYEYNKKGQLVKSYNSRNQSQYYFYLENGLIKNIMNYNTNGDLESEVIYKYKYR